jgi:hypothetical protein
MKYGNPRLFLVTGGFVLVGIVVLIVLQEGVPLSSSFLGANVPSRTGAPTASPLMVQPPVAEPLSPANTTPTAVRDRRTAVAGESSSPREVVHVQNGPLSIIDVLIQAADHLLAPAAAESAGAAPTPVATTAALLVTEDTFSASTRKWPVLTEPTWSTDYVDGRYHLMLDGQNNGSVSTSIGAENYRLGVDLRVDEGSAGLVFLSAEPTTFYHLLISSDATFAIQMQQVGHRFTNLIAWQRSNVLRRGSGEINKLRVERQGSIIRFYANDQVLTDFVVPQGKLQNRSGFSIAGTNGQGQASFDNLRVEHFPDT